MTTSDQELFKKNKISGQLIENETYENVKFSEKFFEKMSFHDCRFIKCQFEKVELNQTNITNVHFEKCDFGYSFWGNCSLLETTFSHCSLNAAVWEEVTVTKCCLKETEMRSFFAMENKWSASSLEKVSLHQGDWIKCEFRSVVFNDVHMFKCNMQQSHILSCRFTSIDLERAKFYRCRFEANHFEACQWLRVKMFYSEGLTNELLTKIREERGRTQTLYQIPIVNRTVKTSSIGFGVFLVLLMILAIAPVYHSEKEILKEYRFTVGRGFIWEGQYLLKILMEGNKKIEEVASIIRAGHNKQSLDTALEQLFVLLNKKKYTGIRDSEDWYSRKLFSLFYNNLILNQLKGYIVSRDRQRVENYLRETITKLENNAYAVPLLIKR